MRPSDHGVVAQALLEHGHHTAAAHRIRTAAHDDASGEVDAPLVIAQQYGVVIRLDLVARPPVLNATPHLGDEAEQLPVVVGQRLAAVQALREAGAAGWRHVRQDVDEEGLHGVQQKG